MRRIILAVVVATGWFLMGVSADETPPVIPACERAPRLDGKLDDAAWRDALIITNFVVIGEAELRPSGNVVARLMRDDAWLYIGFDVKHPMPDTITKKVVVRDGKVQRENCVKISFDPGMSGKQWYHFRLSAHNVRAEQRHTNVRVELEWNIPWRSATQLTDTGWQAELALPFALLMEMGDPEKAKINLLVHTFTPIYDPNAVEVGETREVASWAPLPTTKWDVVDRFIPVSGLGNVAFKAPFLPMLESVAVGSYAFTDDKYRYDVSGSVRNYSGRSGKVVMRVRDMPVAGAVVDLEHAIEVTAGAETNFDLAVPVQSVVRRNVQIEMVSADGEILDSVLIENPPVLDLFSAYLDRDYYTTDEYAAVTCRIGLPETALKNTYLAARTSDGKLLGETRAVKPYTELRFPLKDIQTGTYPVQIEFRQPDGALIADQPVTLIKRAPQPGLEWKIDRVNRVVLHDNEPYFAYGICFGGWNRAVFNEENYQELVDAGFNSFIRWAAPGTVEATLEGLDAAARHGLHMIVVPNAMTDFVPVGLPGEIKRYSMTSLKVDLVTKLAARFTRAERSRIYADVFRQAAPSIRTGIEAVRGHPALMAYESFDEPVSDASFDQYVQGRELYDLIRTTDGYRPVRLLWGTSGPPADEKYTDWCDILACDPYWAPPVRSVRSSPNYVAKMAALLAARGEKERKPVWLTPVFENYSGHEKRCTLPAEQQAQTWLAIIHRVTGLFYFVYPAVHQATWDMMKQLGREIRDVHSIITSPLTPCDIVYDGGEFDPARDKLPDVHASLRVNPAGGYALLAVNAQPWPVQARFVFAGMRLNSPVRRRFGKEEYTVADAGFADILEPFGRRVYLLQAAPMVDCMPAVTVFQEALKADYVQENLIPKAGRPSVRNIWRNPSFEEASMPEFPDYWFVAAHSVPTFPSERVGRENALYMLDTDRPFHGARSFRITAPANRSVVLTQRLSPQHDRPAPYVLSAWMRAARAGTTVELRGAGMKKTTLTMTEDWQRYHVRLTVPANAEWYSSYGIWLLGGESGAQIWVDAMQFEQGTEPTDFEP